MMMSLKHTAALGFLLTFALAGQARAAIKFPSVDDSGYDAKITAKDRSSPKTSRKPSGSETVGEPDLPEDFKKPGGFRERFLKVNAAEAVNKGEVGLAEFLEQAEKDYNGYSADVRFFIAQLETIRPLRSIVFRMRKLSEKNKQIEASAVIMMKSIASMMKIYLPTDQWNAGWEYVTKPSRKDEKVNHQFDSIHELQGWASGNSEGDLAKALTDASNRIFAIYKERVNNPGQRGLVLDNQLSYGTGTFPDGLDRYRTFENPEILSALATLQISLHSIKVFAAYDQDQFFEYFAEVGRQAGVGQILNPDADVGLSALDRCKILMEPQDLIQRARERLSPVCNPNIGGAKKYGGFLKIRAGGQALMASAGEHLAAAIDYLNTAWEDMQPLGDSAYAWIDPGKVKPSKREIELRLKNMKAMVKGPTMLRSALTGERVCVDLPRVFNHAPSDLKEYFATGFKTDIPSDDTLKINGHSYNYRNYDHGRATAWSPEKWGEYVKVVASNGPDDCGHDVGKQSPTSMGEALKILRQSWGGDYVSPVLDFVMR